MRAFPEPPKVRICTMLESPLTYRGLTGVGASVYVLKSHSAEHLVAAVRAAVLDQEWQNVVVGMPTEMLEGTEGVLSARELEVLLLASRGLLRQTQHRFPLHLAEGTVKRHLANVYQKRGATPGARPLGRLSLGSGSPWRRSRSQTRSTRESAPRTGPHASAATQGP